MGGPRPYRSETMPDPAAVSFRPERSARPPADVFMRRLLRVRDERASGTSAERLFGKSLLLSTVRCLLTYIVLPLLKPVVDLSGGVGPVLGLVIGTISAVAILASMRRFWAADHRMRWGYTAVGGAILVLLVFQAVGDVAALI